MKASLTLTVRSVSTPESVRLTCPVSVLASDPVPGTAGVPGYLSVQVDPALGTLLGVAALCRV